MFKFIISGIRLEIDVDIELKEDKAFNPFDYSFDEADWKVQLKSVAEVFLPERKPVYRNEDYFVYSDGSRGYIDRKDSGKPYAITTIDEHERKVLIRYAAGKKAMLDRMSNILFCMGWEKIFSVEKVMVLHGACVKTSLGGIIFSGPSGIGKSTQADLWCKYKEGKLLNGDRTLISQKNDSNEEWLAFGSPYAGSSKCYINDSCHIKTIVYLGQSSECAIRKLSQAEAFRRLFSQTTVYSYDEAFVATIINLESKLVEDITVYELQCTPDEKAVNLLWETIERERDYA